MDYQALGNWLSNEAIASIGEEQLDLSGCSVWDWPCDSLVEYREIDPIPLRLLPPDPSLQCAQDILQEFHDAFERGGCGLYLDGGGDAAAGSENMSSVDALVPLEYEKSECSGDERKDVVVAEGCGGGRGREEAKSITFEEVSRYFYVPITQAAKELNVGLTQLKKKCRELGIPRWPHRKMKSLQALIKNVQELRREDGEMGDAQLRRAIEILEMERETIERVPGTQLEERTKRLRQACFKANFKKRRLCTAESDLPPAAAAAASLRSVVKKRRRDEEEVLKGRLRRGGPASARTINIKVPYVGVRLM